MLTSDLFQETISAISSNKIRSGLTILGIVIGIGSVIAMISVGQGAQQSIQSSIQSIGSNLIIIMPGAPRGVGNAVNAGRGNAQTLTLDDANAIAKETAGIKAIAPEASKRYQVAAKSQNTNTQVVGTVPDYTSVRNLALDTGAFITEQDRKGLSKIAIIGPATRDDLFGAGADPIGQSIRINQVSFKIVGLTKSKGGTGFGNQDDMIFVPLETAQRYLANSNYVSTISVQANDQSQMTAIQNQITDLLLRRHKIANPQLADFQVMNQSDIVATASSVTGTFTILLSAIAGISLIVGGIGIMNMMLTNVTERTREIGLRKAIGAKSVDISRQFLAEAVTLTFLGGVVGIILGWLISMAIASFAGIATSISTSSIFLAFGVSAAIGIIFGYYPARSAAAMSPIEALRYE